MYLFDLKQKLKKCNPLLYVTEDRAAHRLGFGIASVCLRKNVRADIAHAALGGEVAKDYAQGKIDEVLCGVPTEEVPEHDIFDSESGALLKRGWRGVLLILANKKVISLSKARRVFGCTGLGIDEYDRLTHEGRLAWFRGERFVKKPGLILENF